MDTTNTTEDPMKEVSPEEVAEEKPASDKKAEESSEKAVEENPVETAGGDNVSSSANKVDEEELVKTAEEKEVKEVEVQAEQKTEEPSKADDIDSTPQQVEGTALDESDEKFEDAVDSEEHLEAEQTSKSIKEAPSKEVPSEASSAPSFTALQSCSSENLITLHVTESFEIEDSPEKSPVKMVPNPAAKVRPGPSAVKRLPIKSPEIVTVDLDDDDDDEDDDEETGTAAAVRDEYDDEEDDFEEDDEDDYYDDPESDDQDVSRVIQGAMDALEDPESDNEEDKMDVSSDEDDYSEDDEQPSVVVPKGVASDSANSKRKRSDYLEEEEIYDYDEDEPEEDADDDDDEVAEVVALEGGKHGEKKNPKAAVSMGQISVEDESDEDVAARMKKKPRKVSYKSYKQKLMAKIRRRTYKLLNKRSMHVMEEGSDALVCSDAAKIVSLKSTISSVGVKTAPEEAATIKDHKSKEEQTVTPNEVQRKEREEAVVTSGDAAKVVSEHKKDDENKENMTVKDNAKEEHRRVEADEKVKTRDEESIDKKDREEEDGIAEDIMDSIDDIVADAKKQNGSRSDFNDELTFQMDVDGSEKDDDDNYEHDEDEDEDDEEEGAVDLSSSYDTNKSDQQTDDSDAVETIDSSPEKDMSKFEKPARKPEPLQLDNKNSSDSRTSSTENQIVVKKEVEDDSEDNQEPTTASAKKSSPSRTEKQSEKSREAETVSRKRRRSVEQDETEDGDEPLVPSKKLKRELETNYPTHDRLLKEYIETTSNHSVDDIQKHTDALTVEIQTLNEMIRAKEIEWNNMIHLKKVKEEILLRLTRKKHVMDVMHTKLGEVSEYSHFDSSNLTNVRSASVGPRPPTPPPEVDIRPASVTPMHSSTLNNSKNANVSINSISGSRQIPGSKDNSLFAQFNHSNSSVTMVPLSTSSSLITSTNTILQSRANMKSSEVAKEKPNAAQIQRQILPKPVLSNHQQILNNLAMSAGLTAAGTTSSGATSISNSSTTATVASAANLLAGLSNNILAGLSAQTAALLNGHHHPSASNHLSQAQANQLQVGRQGVIKDVKSIIADYRQKHPEQVPRRGRRLKNIPTSGYEGITITNKSGSSRMPELGFLLGEDDEADDSVDRLVIDEGDDHHHHGTANSSRNEGHRESGVVITTRGGNGPEFHENEVPECQGCKKREAQFVCAGCGNQWYCSRECQVNAWDDHSEVCTG
ncbi:probable serine/threonine-protein kinase kinX isoform X3 [Aedes aegypti]|uniref:Uncharacterized protein n=1 Tax=Aedes aegypti TaxID=7159 RepID=A0A6I8T3V8_AEDAE|nr:probable serine/threonine-protein kinase kinX isoform X3 [Aedes aegypti]